MNTTHPVDDDLWNVARAAKYLGKSLCWVYRAVERGELPVLRIGASLRFDPAEIRAWAKRQKAGADAIETAGNGRVIPLRPNAGDTVNPVEV